MTCLGLYIEQAAWVIRKELIGLHHQRLDISPIPGEDWRVLSEDVQIMPSERESALNCRAHAVEHLLEFPLCLFRFLARILPIFIARARAILAQEF